MSTSSLYDSAVHGLTGEGVTDEQPALASLVDQLGDEYAEDGQAAGDRRAAGGVLQPGRRDGVALGSR